jgi:hypothetical protein
MFARAGRVRWLALDRRCRAEDTAGERGMLFYTRVLCRLKIRSAAPRGVAFAAGAIRAAPTVAAGHTGGDLAHEGGERLSKRSAEGSDMNVLSVIIGLMALVVALVGFIPLLGWLNWFAIPGAVVGLVLGLLSQKTSGRNVNLVVLALAIVRLALGGGIL